MLLKCLWVNFCVFLLLKISKKKENLRGFEKVKF
jgi:hypothetical protein